MKNLLSNQKNPQFSLKCSLKLHIIYQYSRRLHKKIFLRKEEVE